MADPTNDLQQPAWASSEELNALVESVTITRETAELKARFPSHLAELASRIQLRRPKERIIISQQGGAYGSGCEISTNEVYLSVLMDTENGQLVSHPLTLTCSHWSIFYRSGGAGSETVCFSVALGSSEAEAFVAEYGDPGMQVVEYAHGDTDEILKFLLKGSGGDECARDELELVEILLGDDVKAHLDAEVQLYPPLRQVIKEHLEHKNEL